VLKIHLQQVHNCAASLSADVEEVQIEWSAEKESVLWEVIARFRASDNAAPPCTCLYSQRLGESIDDGTPLKGKLSQSNSQCLYHIFFTVRK